MNRFTEKRCLKCPMRVTDGYWSEEDRCQRFGYLPDKPCIFAFLPKFIAKIKSKRIEKWCREHMKNI